MIITILYRYHIQEYFFLLNITNLNLLLFFNVSSEVARDIGSCDRYKYGISCFDRVQTARILVGFATNKKMLALQ